MPLPTQPHAETGVRRSTASCDGKTRPPNFITCAGCGAGWTGLSACHCSGCHRTFTGLSAFDIHRVGGQCSDPADIVNQKGEPRLVRAEKPHWSGWACPGDDTRWEAS